MPCNWTPDYSRDKSNTLRGSRDRERNSLSRTLRNVYGVGRPTVGTTSSVRLHICAVTYMTAISLHVTLNTNKLKTEKPPFFSRLLRRAWGIRRTFLSSTPGSPLGLRRAWGYGGSIFVSNPRVRPHWGPDPN